MKRLPITAMLPLLLAVTAACAAAPAAAFPRLDPQATIERIAIGSCLDEERAPPRWQTLLDRRPDLLILAGDNVYADTVGTRYVGPDISAMREAYAQLGAVPGFRELRARVPVLGVWDDHDYGIDDGGAEHPAKEAAKQLFAEFFDVPADDAMRGREGIYRAETYGPPGRRVQIIQLDTRWFRSPLKPTDRRGAAGRQRYLPDPDPAKTLLGAAQWRWLEEELRRPAELRFIVSSIQVLAEGHGWERWGNLPSEVDRLKALIGRTAANGVVLLSGDRHRAGVYRRADGWPYPMHEMTASSLNAGVVSRQREDDPGRLGGPLYAGENFGYIEIDWDARVVHLDVRSLPDDRRVRGVTVAFEELRP